MTTTTQYAGLAGKTAIVTGGASGIGEAITRQLCAQGTKVTVLDIAEQAGTNLVDELNSTMGPNSAVFFNCDLRDIAALRDSLARSHDVLGPASILVNNAANDLREDFDTVEPDQFDMMIEVNLRHVFFACQAVAKQMRSNGGGSIINMSSGAWIGGSPDAPSYCAAKAAIVGLTNSLARRLGGDNIRVNALAPGAVRTDRQMRLWHSEESMQSIIDNQCIKHQLLPEHIAKSVLFLASDDAEMITKQLILVNAGLR